MVDRFALSCPCSCHGRGSYAACDDPYAEGCGHLHVDPRNASQDRRRAPNGACPGCGAGVADSALCVACTARFLADLAAVPFLARELETLRAKLARIGEAGPGGGTSEIPLGYRPFAAEVADVLHVTLAVWARYVATEQRLALDVPAEPIRLAVWLTRWSEPVRHLTAVAQLTDEIGYAVRVARRTIDRPADRAYLGPCDDCDDDLYASPHATQVHCVCGRAYLVEERRRWLLVGLREHLATAGEIAAGIGDLYGEPINRKRINQWHHRHPARLPERGRTREGWPLFRIGDVLALASGLAAATRRAVIDSG